MGDFFHVLDQGAITRIDIVAVTDDHTLADTEPGTLLRVDKTAVAQIQEVDISGLATSAPFTLVIADNPTSPLLKSTGMGSAIQAALEGLPNIGSAGVTAVTEPSTDIYDIAFATTLGSVPIIDVSPRVTVTTTRIAVSGTVAGIQQFYFENTGGGTYALALGMAGPAGTLTPFGSTSAIKTVVDGLVGAGSVSVGGSGTPADPYVVTFDVNHPPAGQLIVTTGSLTGIAVSVADPPPTPAVTEVSLTIPQVDSGAGTSFALGARLDFVQAGTCVVRVVAGTGVTVDPASRDLTRQQWSVAGLVMDQLDHWIVFGDLVET